MWSMKAIIMPKNSNMPIHFFRFYNDGASETGGGNGGDPSTPMTNKSLIVSNNNLDAASQAANKKSLASKIKSLFGM